MYAVYRNNNPEVVSLLLENSADVNAGNDAEETTLTLVKAPEVISILTMKYVSL
jgi:ankyrin repeat protein